MENKLTKTKPIVIAIIIFAIMSVIGIIIVAISVATTNPETTTEQIEQKDWKEEVEVEIVKDTENDSAKWAGSDRVKSYDIIIKSDLDKNQMEEFARWYFDKNNLQLLNIYTNNQAYSIAQKMDNQENVSDDEYAIFDEKYIINMMYNWSQKETHFNWMATEGKYSE